MHRASPFTVSLIGTDAGRAAVRDRFRIAGFAIRERQELLETGAHEKFPESASLLCVVLEHPDQYPPEHVRKFLASGAGVRILCVRLAWCSSLLRSRSDWPAAVVVDLAALPHRLEQEVERLRGKLAPLPLTAGLEEIAAASLSSPPTRTDPGRLARVISADRDYRETLEQQLADAGVARSSQDSDLLVLDVDSISDAARRQHQARMPATARLVLLTAVPDQFPDEHTPGAVVASKFSPVSDWLHRVVFALCFALGTALAGCAPAAPARSSTTVPAQKSWAEQVQAVREGAATSIVTTQPVSSSAWADLSSGCSSLEVLEAEQATLTSPDFDRLLQLPNLRRLRIGSSFTDTAATTACRHPQLSELVIASDSLTDAGVVALCQRPLTQLRIRAPRVTDAAMPAIGRLEQLRFLHLIDIPITDAGLLPLADLESLESLYLDRAKCTDEGLSALLKRRPDIHFHRDQTHLHDDPRSHPH